MEHRCERWWNPGVTPSNCPECDKKNLEQHIMTDQKPKVWRLKVGPRKRWLSWCNWLQYFWFTLVYFWFFLTIVNVVYRPTYSWGTPPCMEGGMLLNLAHGPAFSDMIQHGHGWHVSYTHIPNLPIISRARVSRLDFNLFKNTYRFNQ